MQKILLMSICGLLSACASVKEETNPTEWTLLYNENRNELYYLPTSVEMVDPQRNFWSITTVDNGGLALIYGVGSFYTEYTVDCNNNSVMANTAALYIDKFARGTLELQINNLQTEFHSPDAESESKIVEFVCK